MAKKKTRQLKITQSRSVIGRPEPHKRTIKALGLRRMHQSVVIEDSPTLQGMLFKVKHLVQVEEIQGK